MKHISSKSPTATVYKCENGGLHLVIRDVNITLNESEFYSTNEHIQRASMMIDNGTWPSEYVQLTFCKVTLIVHTSDLLIVAKVMRRAKIVMENRENEEKIININKGNRQNTLPIVDKKKLRPFFKN
tara:strand:+ start:143 stop:523 length:381 start_codon:yes stop_codon:yes gene_type:complete